MSVSKNYYFNKYYSKSIHNKLLLITIPNRYLSVY